VAAETVLSRSDGARGILWVRGRTLDELVTDYGYEGTVALFWEGFLGDGLTRDGTWAKPGWPPLCASVNGSTQRRTARWSREFACRPPAILATLSVAIAALIRTSRGQAPLAPEPNIGSAADLLRMIHGQSAAEPMAAALDDYFTALSENGLSSSSFAARIIASTRASLVGAVLGAYCAFSGPLHGGAPGPTLDMLDDAEASGDIGSWVGQKLATGERLMGFGLRTFPNGDPRAEVLRRALERLHPGAGRLTFAAEVEQQVRAVFTRLKPGRPPLKPNVEINAALLLDAVGVPREAFTPVLAVARCAGWLAHAMEHRKADRLIRPSSAYIGPVPAAARELA
jgi:citrate synthase